MATDRVAGQLHAPANGSAEAFLPSAATNGLQDHSRQDTGPGPIRHPRPLTAAELHLELEKEQEAVVNRLTRELVALRQQTASVASTASSTSAGLPEVEHGTHNTIFGPTHPISSRRHRSSSNLSAQGVILPSGINNSAASGIAAPRDAATTSARGQNARHDSLSSSRRSEASSPRLASSLAPGEHLPPTMASRNASTAVHGHNLPGSLPPHRTISASSSRFEEVALQRAELENVRRENEALRGRIRELERQLSIDNRRASIEPASR